MEDENEVLDWGNEDDEQQDHHRKVAAGDHNLGDADDVEDSVSLGEDDDEQEYYAYQHQDSNGITAYTESKSTALSTSKLASHTNERQPPHIPEELKREDSSTSQALSSTAESPQRLQNSTTQQSPQRSNSFTTRITHALPPKPVVANVPFLHPSHPSIVAATAMSTRPSARSESNKTQVIASSSTTVSTIGTGGGRSSSSGTADPDTHALPPGWEIRHPRTGGGVYYYNPQTSQSTWTLPVSSSNSFPGFSDSHSSNARRRRGRSLSAGSRSPSLPRSNAVRLQSQEHSRQSKRTQPLPDLDIIETQAPPSTGALSYEDRHYRPGGAEPVGPSTDTRRGDRSRNEPVDPRFNPHPELAFTPPPSPPRARDRERARSLSPEPLPPSDVPRGRDSRAPRGARPGRAGRNGNTDPDFAMQRDRDVAPRSHWSQTTSNPSADFNINTQQGPRRQPRQQNIDSSFESSVFEGRAPMQRNGSTRARNRDRDQPRVMEVREQNRHENMSAPRIRSPPPHMRDVDQPRDLPSEQDQQQPIPTSAVPPPSTPSVAAVPPPQRKRQSRFDRPLSTPASTAPSLPTSSTSKPATSGPAALHQAMLDDDPFVPDDIRSPPQEPQGEAELVRDELTQISLPQQVSPPEDDIRPPPPSLYPNRRARPGDRDSDQDRTHSPSEQERSSPSSLTSHRKREPLPPQSARFREISGRPTPLPTDRGGPSQGQVRPPQLSPSQTTAQLPLGPRDAQRSADSNNLPLGPRYTGRGAARVYPAVPTGGSIDREGPGGDRRPSELIHPPPQSLVESAMDIDISPSEITPSPRISSFEEFPQSGPGMYADRELIGAGDMLPRGPRAMSSKGPPRTASTSPVASFGFGPTTGGRVDRSPPPHLAGRANEGGREYEDPRWKDDRRVTGGFAMERGQGRPPRGRNIEYSRVPSAPLSGPNSVPIGNRKGSGLPTNIRMPSNSGPPLDVGVVDTRPPLRPSRSARGRGGGPPLPPRETHEWDDRSRVGSYGSRGRSESSGPRRDRSLPPFDKHQPLAVNTSVGHEIGPYSGGDQSRFDPSQQPRTWTPRGVAPPHEVIRASFSAGSDGRGAMSPPPSREPSQVSPTWEEVEPRRPPLRSSARQGGSRGAGADVDLRSRQQLDNLPPRGRDSYVPTSEPPRRSGSLEGRLSDRYDEHVIETPRQLHALPPNPALHRDHKSYSPESRRRPPPDRRLRQQEFGSGWADAATARDAPLPSRLTDVHSNRMFSDQTLHALDDHNSRGQRPPRPRRLPQSFPRQDEPMAMDTEDLPPPHMHPPEHVPPYIHDRPEFARRGHSLLERLSLDPNSESREEMSSQSLQERVQVPSKRDRDEMVDRYPMDSSFDGEDGGLGDGLRKRRKSTKPRKQRRGGGP